MCFEYVSQNYKINDVTDNHNRLDHYVWIIGNRIDHKIKIRIVFNVWIWAIDPKNECSHDEWVSKNEKSCYNLDSFIVSGFICRDLRMKFKDQDCPSHNVDKSSIAEEKVGKSIINHVWARVKDL